MKKVLLSGALVWAGAAVLLAQSAAPRTQAAQSPSAPATPAAKVAASTPAPSPADAPKYQAWLKQNCVACHNSKSASPANDPVNLETASLTDPLPHAVTWERVLRKLSVRAMPPPGLPH